MIEYGVDAVIQDEGVVFYAFYHKGRCLRFPEGHLIKTGADYDARRAEFNRRGIAVLEAE